MSGKLIYIVEDEPDIAELIQINLLKEGFQVKICTSGQAFFQELELQTPDLILLDLMLPDMGGLQICEKIRNVRTFSELPIVMVTAKGDELDIVKGLEAGADDYVTKPFSPKVLVARLNTILKRASRKSPVIEGLITKGPISIHKGRFEVSVSGQAVTLTKSEFSILLLLASHPGWVYSRAQIVDAIRGDNYSVTERTIDFQMVGLRKKLQEAGEWIETVRGVGYRFRDC